MSEFFDGKTLSKPVVGNKLLQMPTTASQDVIDVAESYLISALLERGFANGKDYELRSEVVTTDSGAMRLCVFGAPIAA